MVRQFKLGGVYKCEVGMKDEELGVSFLIKVVGLGRARRVCSWDRLQYRIFGKSKRSLDELIGGTPACVHTKNIEAPPFSEIDLESFFVCNVICSIVVDPAEPRACAGCESSWSCSTCRTGVISLRLR